MCLILCSFFTCVVQRLVYLSHDPLPCDTPRPDGVSSSTRLDFWSEREPVVSTHLGGQNQFPTIVCFYVKEHNLRSEVLRFIKVNDFRY